MEGEGITKSRLLTSDGLLVILASSSPIRPLPFNAPTPHSHMKAAKPISRPTHLKAPLVFEKCPATDNLTRADVADIAENTATHSCWPQEGHNEEVSRPSATIVPDPGGIWLMSCVSDKRWATRGAVRLQRHNIFPNTASPVNHT